GAVLGGAVGSAAGVAGCQGPVDASAGGEPAAGVTGDVTGAPLDGAGGVQPVGGSGSTFCWTIFSRLSRTLKLNRRRFGFPRRPPCWAGDSPMAGSTAGGLPKAGIPPAPAGITGGARDGGAGEGPDQAAVQGVRVRRPAGRRGR